LVCQGPWNELLSIQGYPVREESFRFAFRFFVSMVNHPEDGHGPIFIILVILKGMEENGAAVIYVHHHVVKRLFRLFSGSVDS
jgi:hypothetical protein